MVKRIGIAVLACLMFVTAGCSATKTLNSSTEPTYIMPESMDAMSYQLFINKEINACTNQLSTLMLLCDSYSDGTYPAEDLLEGANFSLGIINEAYDQVDIMTPAPQYEDTRENVLRMMNDAKYDVEQLIDYLSSGDNELNIYEITSLMQADFMALTGEFNVFYE